MHGIYEIIGLNVTRTNFLYGIKKDFISKEASVFIIIIQRICLSQLLSNEELLNGSVPFYEDIPQQSDYH